MDDVFYIVITVIFGVFVLAVMFWLYRYMNKKSLLDKDFADLSDQEKQMASRFCEQMRLASQIPDASRITGVSTSTTKRLVSK